MIRMPKALDEVQVRKGVGEVRVPSEGKELGRSPVPLAGWQAQSSCKGNASTLFQLGITEQNQS